MAKVLLIGTPTPAQLGRRRIEAAHYRTWQFLQPLLEAGEDVALCAAVPAPETGADATAAAPAEGLAAMYWIRPSRAGWRRQLKQAYDDFRPDCVVAVNFQPAVLASSLTTTSPVWMDIYGDQLTIQQSFCHRSGSDRGMPTAIRFMRQILQTTDVLSTCGEYQRHMAVGELAMAGRLNCSTFGYEFVRVIYPGAPPPSKDDPTAMRTEVRGRLGLPPDAFCVLWCGGYNTWTDVDTLYRGIASAMERNPRLHYVSVGASTYQARDNVYEQLQARVRQGALQDRWHLEGWRPWQEVPAYYQACEVGLNIDAMHYETVYGTRTRLLEMIGAGLPVLTTTGTELSAILRDAGAALTFQPGAHEGLAECLLRLAGDEPLLANMSQVARDTAESRFSFAATTEPLLRWVRNPTRAPDRIGTRAARIGWQHQLRALARLAMWRLMGSERSGG